MEQRIFFSDEDLVKLGNTAEMARSFLNQIPTRGEYDAWMNEFKSVVPNIGLIENRDGDAYQRDATEEIEMTEYTEPNHPEVVSLPHA